MSTGVDFGAAKRNDPRPTRELIRLGARVAKRLGVIAQGEIYALPLSGRRVLFLLRFGHISLIIAILGGIVFGHDLRYEKTLSLDQAKTADTARN